jgi:Tfp pilus assembly protein FimT
MLVMAFAITMCALTLPQVNNFLQSQRARNAASVVERSMQTARLKAVSASRSLRVRIGCPAAGQIRILEVTGMSTTDDASNRCNTTAYPSPGPRDSLQATPSMDSPVIYLPDGTTVTGSALNLEFDPRGAVYSVSSTGTTAALTGDVVLTVTRAGYSQTVTINALGRVRLN